MPPLEAADSGGTARRRPANRSSGMIMASNLKWKIPPWRKKICWAPRDYTSKVVQSFTHLHPDIEPLEFPTGQDASKHSSPDNVGDGLVLLREVIDLRREIRKIADTSSVIPPAMPVKPRQTLKAVNSEELRQYRDRDPTGLIKQALLSWS